MGVWYPTRGQIGNRSDPHGKHRNDARPFLINRQPFLSLSFSLSLSLSLSLFFSLCPFLYSLLCLLRLSSEIYGSTFVEPFRIEFAPLELRVLAIGKFKETLKLYAQM